MAEFSKLVITEKGWQLIFKIFSGTTGVKFTKISTSSKAYGEAELSTLEALEEIRQTSLVAGVERTERAAVKVFAAFTNAELTEGYYLRSMGLFAEDPDEGEILYGVTAELSGNCYMPPYNGATLSGIDVEMVTVVGNAENISLEVNPAAVPTISQVNNLAVSIRSHCEGNVYGENGIHGMRYFNEKLQVQNELGNWVEVETGEKAVARHDEDYNAHPTILEKLSELYGRIVALEEVVGSEITANAFAVTFGTLDGISAEGYWNFAGNRLEF